ncbi:hypothetical protein HAX54_001373, partial [Datura stramonium]|nr:hypothetical protein [Datura stramonium]
MGPIDYRHDYDLYIPNRKAYGQRFPQILPSDGQLELSCIYMTTLACTFESNHVTGPRVQ